MTGRRFRIATTLLVWAAFAMLPLVVAEWYLGKLAQLITYGIFAMSLAFVWGQVGLLCFGQAIFFGTGAYAMALVTKGMLPGIPDTSPIGLAAAVVLPALVANLLGQFLFRGRGVSGAYFAIVTLSAAVVAERLASHWRFIGGFNGLLNVPPLRLGSGPDALELFAPLPTYYAMLAAAGAVYLGLLALERAPLGSVLRAVRDHEERTTYFGYDVAACKRFAFTISGGVAGLAGALFVTQFGFVSPALIGFSLSTEVLIWTALGGREVLLAAWLAAILVRTVEGILSEALGHYWLLALGVLLVVSVVFLPRGLLGWLLRLPLPARLER
jgi:branched-chain amino acid transport system permease protein/urea transport system permease protein